MDYFELWESGHGPCIPVKEGEIFDPGPEKGIQAAELLAEQELAQTATPEDFPCIYRGSDPTRHVGCEQCGHVGKQVAVYSCTLFAECSISRWGVKTREARKMHACLTCGDRQAPDDPQSPGAAQ